MNVLHAMASTLCALLLQDYASSMAIPDGNPTYHRPSITSCLGLGPKVDAALRVLPAAVDCTPDVLVTLQGMLACLPACMQVYLCLAV